MKKKDTHLYWFSFARPGENYVVLTEETDHNRALAKVIPLKNFNPRGWAMECAEVEFGGPEDKDFKRDVLITEGELRAKGYLKPSEQLRQN